MLLVELGLDLQGAAYRWLIVLCVSDVTRRVLGMGMFGESS